MNGGTPLNRAGNTYWLSNRHGTQRATAQALPQLSISEVSREFIPTTIGRLGLMPSWVIFGMILLATLGICAATIVRTRAESRASLLQYQQMSAEIDTARRVNQSLQIEVRSMTTDPRIIESAARTRLGMVRPNDVVIPIESVKQGSAIETLSFVR
jgi:cell division protein FtsL